MPRTYVADSAAERARRSDWRAPNKLTVMGMSGYTHGVRLVRMPATNRMPKVAAETPLARPSLPDRSAPGPTPCVKRAGRKGSPTPTTRASARREGQFFIARILTARALTCRVEGYNRPVQSTLGHRHGNQASHLHGQQRDHPARSAGAGSNDAVPHH